MTVRNFTISAEWVCDGCGSKETVTHSCYDESGNQPRLPPNWMEFDDITYQQGVDSADYPELGDWVVPTPIQRVIVMKKRAFCNHSCAEKFVAERFAMQMVVQTD